MTRKGTDAFPLLVVIVAVAAALSGCVASDQGNPPSQDQLPTQTATVWLRSASMLILSDAIPGSHVQVSQTQEQFDAAKSCKQEGPYESHYFWVNVWNRTGLAYYEHKAVGRPLEALIEHEFSLPSDPPFLIWLGITCSAPVHVEFQASQWKQTTGNIRGDIDEGDPLRIVEPSTQAVAVRIPAGETLGTGTLPIYGSDFFLSVGLAAGYVERESGNRYGDAFVYEPQEEPPGGEWFMHTAFTPFGTDAEDTHTPRGVNGDYWIVVELSSLATQETTWRFSADVLTFRSVISNHGFDYPFALYDRDPSR